MPPLLLLGPQRLRPIVARELAERGIGGPVATVTAGWEDREAEDAELDAHLTTQLGGSTFNLRLHERYERVLNADRFLADAIAGYDRRLTEIRGHYRLRLRHALDAARALLREPGDSPELRIDRTAAIEAVQRLDDELVRRIALARAEFAGSRRLSEHPVIAHEREEVARRLADCGALAIAGGHVGVLLRVLRLFDVTLFTTDLPIAAWAAGAMVLAERIVLFHDHPPQGAGNSEVYDAGLGLYAGIVPLPHARRRLRLEDRVRVTLFARRHAPRRLALMNEGAVLVLGDGRVEHAAEVRSVTTEGVIVPWSPGREAA